MLKQTKAQVFESSMTSSQSTSQSQSQSLHSNYSVIKPQIINKSSSEDKSDRMLEEYLSKLNQLDQDKKGVPSLLKKTNAGSSTTVKTNSSSSNTVKKSDSSDQLTNEFMRVREEKFGKIVENIPDSSFSEDVEQRENQKNLAKNSNKNQNHVRISTASSTNTNSSKTTKSLFPQ